MAIRSSVPRSGPARLATSTAALVGHIILAGCTVASAPSPTIPPASPGPSEAAAPSATPTPVPSAATSPAPSPSQAAASPSHAAASPTPADPALSFERVAAVEGTELHAAVAFEGGFLVGGCRLRSSSGAGGYGGCAEARILRSVDGRSWTDAEVSGGAGRQVLGFADTPLGILAFGSDQVTEPPHTRTVWRSTDGTRWEPFPIPAPEAIVFHEGFVLDGRTVLIGEDSTYDFSVETEGWATTDGRSWTQGETPMTAKFAAEPGIVAIGDGCIDICPEGPLVIHVRRSADGLAWTEEDAPVAVFTTDNVSSWGTWAGRAVLGGSLGDDRSLEATVWFDEEGGWRTARLPDGSGYAIGALVDAGDRLIALGATHVEQTTRRAWWTVDGRTWTSGALDGLGEDDFIAAWAGDDPLVAVVDYQSIWLVTAVPGPVSLASGWPAVSRAGVTLTGSELDEPSAVEPYAPPDYPVSVSLTGLDPGEAITLTATGRYEFATLGCGRTPHPCSAGSDVTGTGMTMCTPLYAQHDVAGTATAQVRIEVGTDRTATATIRLVVPGADKACPADPSLPWYVLSGTWTELGVTDATHGLRLEPPDWSIGP